MGAEEPEHHREPEPVVLPAESDWGHPGDPAALFPPGTPSGTATEPTASSGRGEGKGLAVPGVQG